MLLVWSVFRSLRQVKKTLTTFWFTAQFWWTYFPEASTGRSPCSSVRIATELCRQLLERNFHLLALYTLVAHQDVVLEEVDFQV